MKTAWGSSGTIVDEGGCESPAARLLFVNHELRETVVAPVKIWTSLMRGFRPQSRIGNDR